MGDINKILLGRVRSDISRFRSIARKTGKTNRSIHHRLTRRIKRDIQRSRELSRKAEEKAIESEVKSELESEVISKTGVVNPGERVEISFEDKSGDIKTVNAKLSYIKNLENQGFRVIRISKLSGEVVYNIPSTSEYRGKYLNILKSKYSQLGFIPSSFKENIEIPENIKYLGLEKEYIREAYERSIGLKKDTWFSKSFVGTLMPGFENIFYSKYQRLPDIKKFEYGLRYGDLSNIPMEKWKFYPGGKEYIKQHKEEVITRYLKEKGKHFPIDLSGLKAYRSMGYSYYFFVTKPKYARAKLTDIGYKRWQAYQYLLRTPVERKSFYYSKYPFYHRVSISFYSSMMKATVYPVTFPQFLVKTATGRTWVLPDIEKMLSKFYTAPTRGVMSGLLSEGIGRVTGGKTDYFETVKKYPIESFAAGIGEITGVILGGKISHIGKVSSIRGFGYIRRGLISKYGIHLPSYVEISYHYPQRYLRRWWVKLGTKNIEEAMGKPIHTIETLTEGGFSFAPGKTPSERIWWTIQKAGESRELPLSEGDILLSSASGARVGTKYIIQPKIIHELPSMSYTPYGYAPTHFYGFYPKLSYSSSVGLVSKMWRPTNIVTRVSKLFEPPTGSYKEIAEWAMKQLKGKWSVLGPKMYKGGPETEINIFGKTILKRFLPTKGSILHRIKGYKYYGEVPLEGGRLIEVVPVVFTEPVHYGYPRGVKEILGRLISKEEIEGITEGVSEEITSYTIPIITPRYLISTLSYKPSSKISYTYTISKPLYPSIPSYPSPSSYPSYLSKPSYSSRSSTVSKQLSISPSISAPSYPSKPSYSSRSSTVSKPSLFSPPSIPSYPSYPSPPKIISYPSTKYGGRSDYGRESVKKKEGAYNVLVKDRVYVKGKKRYRERFIRVNRKPLSYEDAMSYGATVVDNSAARTFKVVPVKGKIKRIGKPDIPVDSWNMIGYKFYKRNNRYIESVMGAIDTRGEIKQISARGWIAERRRKTRKTSRNSFNIRYVKPDYNIGSLEEILRGYGFG